MLAAIESGFVDYAISCRPDHVVYMSRPGAHIERLLGLTAWDPNGPKYVLDDSGTAVRIGRFSDPGIKKPVEPQWRKYLFDNWLTFRKVFGPWSPIDSDAIQLYLGMIRTARDLVAQNYPGADFHLLLWDVTGDKKLAELVGKELENDDIQVDRVSEIIPDYDKRKDQYQIKTDGHPTPIVYKKMAAYLVEEFLSPEF
jgi:hypothetical protein